MFQVKEYPSLNGTISPKSSEIVFLFFIPTRLHPNDIVHEYRITIPDYLIVFKCILERIIYKYKLT